MIADTTIANDLSTPSLIKIPDAGLGIGRYDERQARHHPACYRENKCVICGTTFFTKLKSRVFYTCSHECSQVFMHARKHQKSGGYVR